MSRSLRRTHSVKSRAFWPIILMASVLILGPILTCSASNKAAVVLDLKGMVLLVTLFDGEEETSPLERAEHLPSGEIVRVPEGGSVTLLHMANFQRYLFPGPDEIKIAPRGFDSTRHKANPSGAAKPYRRDLMAALNKHRYLLRTQQTVIGVRVVEEMDFPDIVLSSPLDQDKRLENFPTFRWEAVPDVTSYRFVLKTKEGQTLMDVSISNTLLSLPDTILLKEGQVYTWQVTADTPTKKLSSSKRVFTMASMEEKQLLGPLYPGADAPMDAHVLYILFLEKMGFLGQAQQHRALLEP